MRAGHRAKLSLVTATGLLLSGLGACADDDPHAFDPRPPLAENRLDSPPAGAAQPRVLLLLDSSGSMERRADCSCRTTRCDECLPSCEAEERSRWHLVLEALTGSFTRFACRYEQRTTSQGATYDRGYAIPHVALTQDVAQRDDGLLSRFGAQVRFGVATLDSVPGYGSSELVPEPAFDWTRSQGEQGMNSYAGRDPHRPARARVRPDGSEVGKLYYPASAGPFLLDTGIRSEDAAEGALVMPQADETPESRRGRIVDQLWGVRPFGGSPIAAALDDLDFALDTHPEGAAAKTYLVLITDGPPDDDFRRFPSPGCDCASWQACGEDPQAMSCPYPLATQAAQHLRCGFDPEGCDGALDQLFVIGLAPRDETLGRELDDLAAAGGSREAHFVRSLAALNAQLDAILNTAIASAEP